MSKLLTVTAHFVLWSLILIFLSGISAQPAQASLDVVKIRSVYTADENFHPKNVFMPGDKVNYCVDVDNTTSHTFPIDIRVQLIQTYFLWDPNYYTYDQTYHVDQMQAGLVGFYNPVTIPSDAKSDFHYFVRVTVTPSNSADPANDTDVGENPTFAIQRTKAPEGKAPDGRAANNLIVIVHGCCTDENDVVRDWGNGTPGNTGMAKAIADNIHSPTNEAWEVVVWDWHEYTPKHNYLATALAAGIPATITLIIADADAAYENAKDQGDVLANAIKLHPYKYVHFIAHSAGAKLIQEAATAYMGDYSIRQQNPFIHLTFLDAYTPTESDSSGQGSYGYFPTASPHHYSEHYVDRGVASTDACLSSAFNFDITNWDGADKNPLDPHSGHTWPIRWYKQSVTGSGFHYGYPLSFESSGKDINTLINELSNYPPGKQCALSDIGASCIKALCPSPGSF